jgi:hypothetical protein
VTLSLADLILAEATDDWVPFRTVDAFARDVYPEANETELGNLRNAAIRELLEADFAQIGYVTEVSPFTAWTGSAEEQMARFRRELAEAGEGWMFVVWFNATPRGLERGEGLIRADHSGTGD